MAHSDSGSWQPATGISGERRARALLGATGALATLLLAPLPAAALLNDRVEVFAAENVTYDSNVFRLSDQLDPQTVLGESGRSDTLTSTQLGVSLDAPYSLQRFQANFTWFANRYRRFSDLDFNGHTARAAWLWSVTPHLTGDVGYTDTQTLANFGNFVGIQRNRDVLRIKQAFGDGVWFPVASWRLHAGAAYVEQTHSDPTQRIRDINSTTGVAGASYVTPRDDRLGVEVRAEHGESPHDEFRSGSLTTAYHQDSIGVVGHWIATGHSTLDGRVDYVRRDYDLAGAPSFRGPTTRFAYTWTPSGKTTVLATLYRDIGPIADVQSPSLVIVRGVAVKPSWAATDKITLAGDAEYNIWDYRADIITGLQYTHRVRTLGASISYQAAQRILFQAGYSHEMRTSTLPLADYKDDIVTVSGRIGF